MRVAVGERVVVSDGAVVALIVKLAPEIAKGAVVIASLVSDWIVTVRVQEASQNVISPSSSLVLK